MTTVTLRYDFMSYHNTEAEISVSFYKIVCLKVVIHGVFFQSWNFILNASALIRHFRLDNYASINL